MLDHLNNTQGADSAALRPADDVGVYLLAFEMVHRAFSAVYAISRKNASTAKTLAKLPGSLWQNYQVCTTLLQALTKRSPSEQAGRYGKIAGSNPAGSVSTEARGTKALNPAGCKAPLA